MRQLMAKSQEPKILTRKHLVRAEKELRQQRILIFSLIGFVVVVFGLIAYGLLDQFVFSPTKPVANVDGQNITVKEFKTYGTLVRVSEINTYQQLTQYYNLYQQFGLTPDVSITNQMSQIQYEFSSPATFGQNVITTMVNNVILKNEATKLGLFVTADEVEKTIQESYSFYTNGTPTPASTPTSYMYPTNNATQEYLLMTPSPTVDLTVTATSVPLATETLQALATLLPTEPSTPTSGPTATSSNTPTSQPTATPYTLQGFQNDLKTYIGTLSAYGITETNLRDYVGTQLLDQKIYTEITKDVPTHGQQVWIRNILVANELDAQTVVARINNGENWISVANGVSQDTNTKANGGDLGWFPTGIQSPEIDNVVFTMTVGEIRVVQDNNGWHVLQMIGKEVDRPFLQSIISQLQSIAYTNWFTPIKAAAKIETFNIWQSYVPTAPTLPTPSAQ
jgi:parvulin-like peptidyl-prolyl isomerase